MLALVQVHCEVCADVLASAPEAIVIAGEPESILTCRKRAAASSGAVGDPVIAINVQQEVGSNIVEVMRGVRAAIDEINSAGNLLATESANSWGPIDRACDPTA